MAAKKFTKSALAIGEYQSPDRAVPVTPERLAHWRAQHKRMQANGYDVPISWDHADTLDKLAPVKKRSAKDTVGFLEKIELAPDGKSVELHLDVTDKRGQEQAAANRVYVSPVILDEWKDGGGNVYKDVITHVDFVNHPVDHSQGPFKEIPTVEPGFVACAIRMGLGPAIRMGEFPPDRDEDADNDGKPNEGDSKPEAEPEPENPDMPSDPQEGKQMEALLAHLEQQGLPLASDTTNENLAERLLGALLVANAAKAKAAEDAKSGEESDTNDQGEPIVKEPSYAAMSADARAAHQFAERLHRNNIQGDLDKLLESGRCTPAEHADRCKSLGVVRLSLDGEGKPEVSDLEKWIDSRKPLPQGTFFDERAKTRMSATPVDAPKFSEELSAEEAKKVAAWALTGKQPA